MTWIYPLGPDKAAATETAGVEASPADAIDRERQARLQSGLPPRRAERKPVAAERVYWGHRRGKERIVEVVIDGEARRRLDPRHDLATHSIDDLEWAAGHEAPLQLALAILADATGNRRIALSFYRDFAWEVIKEFPWQHWQMTAEQVHTWLVRKTIEELMPTLPPSRRRRMRFD